jgi:hypothetical protein
MFLHIDVVGLQNPFDKVLHLVSPIAARGVYSQSFTEITGKKDFSTDRQCIKYKEFELLTSIFQCIKHNLAIKKCFLKKFIPLKFAFDGLALPCELGNREAQVLNEVVVVLPVDLLVGLHSYLWTRGRTRKVAGLWLLFSGSASVMYIKHRMPSDFSHT